MNEESVRRRTSATPTIQFSPILLLIDDDDDDDLLSLFSSFLFLHFLFPVRIRQEPQLSTFDTLIQSMTFLFAIAISFHSHRTCWWRWKYFSGTRSLLSSLSLLTSLVQILRLSLFSSFFSHSLPSFSLSSKIIRLMWMSKTSSRLCLLTWWLVVNKKNIKNELEELRQKQSWSVLYISFIGHCCQSLEKASFSCFLSSVL